MFNELFPYYLAIGMTAEQYWDGDCTLAAHYRKADELRQERTNRELWLQGAYFYDALCRVSPVLHAYAKKGRKPQPYLSEPFVMTQSDAEDRETQHVKRTFDKSKFIMEKFMSDTNKRLMGGEPRVRSDN